MVENSFEFTADTIRRLLGELNEELERRGQRVAVYVTAAGPVGGAATLWSSQDHRGQWCRSITNAAVLPKEGASPVASVRWSSFDERRVPMSVQTIGSVFRSERRARGWSQAMLAEEAGVSRPTVAGIEGGQDVSATSLTKLARALYLELALVPAALR